MSIFEAAGALATTLILYAIIGAAVSGNFAKRHPEEAVWDADEPPAALFVAIFWPVYLVATALWWGLVKQVIDWVAAVYRYARGPVPEEDE